MNQADLGIGGRVRITSPQTTPLAARRSTALICLRRGEERRGVARRGEARRGEVK